MTTKFEPDLPRAEDFDADALAAGIIRWVEFETPSDRPDMIDLLLDHVEESFEGLPVTRERIPARDGRGGQLILRYTPAGASGKPAVIMGHIDTVWDAGTLDTRPVRREGDRIHGPGIYDMKAGSYLGTETLRRIAARGIATPRPIIVYLNGDEETGSIASRDTIEALAAEAAYVLIPEPSYEAPGTLVTARKGWARFKLTAHGVSAHAGGSLKDGRNAIVELARHTVEIEGLNQVEAKATFNVGTFHGGTRTNVVPDLAVIEVDMRADDLPTAERVVTEMLARTAKGQDIGLTVEGGINRPPFERTAAVGRLYAAARALGAAIGQDLGETKRGGVSDGNFAAAMGKPVLDGLGCNGAGAHALHEHILFSTIAPRAALMHGMLTSARFNALAAD